MNVPFISLTRDPHKIGKLTIDKIKKIIRKGSFIFGKEVGQFEKKFATYIGTKYCVGVASGTDAIMLSLKTLGVGKGDEVIVPAFTFIATVSPIIFLGAKPILVDILKEKPLIDYSQIEKVITRRTKAILPVHLYGYPCDMEKINKIAKKYKLYVLEDACQAHGSQFQGKKMGAWGDIAAFSFYPGKNLGAFGDAGAIVTSNKLFVEKARMSRDHGQKKKYIHQVLGYNSRLDTINAAVLTIKLLFLDEWNKKRLEIAELYDVLLEDLPLSILSKDKQSIGNLHLYVIRTKARDQLYDYLRRRNILCGIHYPMPLHLQPALANLGYKAGAFPNAENFAQTCLSLPIFPQMTRKEVYAVADQIRNFFSQ